MLSLLSIVVPILSACAVLLVSGQKARTIAIAASLLSLAVTLLAKFSFETGQTWQHVFRVTWLHNPEIQLYFAMDGISWMMLLLSSITCLAAIFIFSPQTSGNYSSFYALLLMLSGAMNGVFLSLDLIVYYVFWELSLIPACLLLLRWGSGNASRVTLKFFLYTLAGSLFMLIAILWLGFQGPNHSFNIDTLSTLALSFNAQTLVFVAFMLAYAVKIPLFPFHTWQQETYASSPVPLTMLLSGVMAKMALYSMIRWLFPLAPNVLPETGRIFLWLSVAGIAYASFIAFMQHNIKKMFAWASMAHLGLIAAGILTLNIEGVKGALLQMSAHTINAIAVLWIIYKLTNWRQSDQMIDFGGLRRRNPFLGGMFLWFVFSFIAVPLTAGFPGELMLLTSLFKWDSSAAALAGLSVILGAVYMLRAYQHAMLGPVKTENSDSENNVIPVSVFEKIFICVLAFLVLWIGIFPQTILNWIDESVMRIFQSYIPVIQQ